jgi:hypothetical protein
MMRATLARENSDSGTLLKTSLGRVAYKCIMAIVRSPVAHARARQHEKDPEPETKEGLCLEERPRTIVSIAF